jgi:hypothetical protein
MGFLKIKRLNHFVLVRYVNFKLKFKNMSSTYMTLYHIGYVDGSKQHLMNQCVYFTFRTIIPFNTRRKLCIFD